MRGWVSVDTLHLSVKYPKADAFTRWSRRVAGVSYRVLRSGVPVAKLVVRSGASGYRLSVWDGDARCYLTDQVDEVVGDGRGMGVWVQLGPRFLGCHVANLKAAVLDFLKRVGIRKDWPARITRIDLAVDVPDHEMASEVIGLWQAGWVGRSRVSSVFFASDTGALGTINVGVRSSGVFLRIYDKVAQAAKEGDLGHWQEVWGGYGGPVIRVEWQVRPGDGGFTELQDFSMFSRERVAALAAYLVEWGRLCVPNGSDSNPRRWAIAPLWEEVVQIVGEWVGEGIFQTVRSGKELSPVSEGYVRFVSGTVSGAMARFDPNDPSWYGLVKGLEGHGQETDFIERKAKEKAAVITRLAGAGSSSIEEPD